MNLAIPPQVTQNAFEHIKATGGNQAQLRVAVDGGGCSGFQYRIEFSQFQEGDLVIKDGETSVVIDPVSLPFLSGAVIDYVDELIGSRFEITNPNAASSCGCGVSFSL